MRNLKRRKTAQVQIGCISMGSDSPVRIQSMTDTPTADLDKTYAQTVELINAGSELVRWTVNDDVAAIGAIKCIKKLRENGYETPIIGDFHFNGHTLLTKHEELAQLLAKYRINPGNVGKGERHDENFETFIKVAIKNDKPVRIGVNFGSLDQELFTRMMDENAALENPKDFHDVACEAMVESALQSAKAAESIGLAHDKIILSVKMSHLPDMVSAYQLLESKCDYPLHLGLTEAGADVKGIASSASALSILLNQGLGDTIRVSLTPQPGIPRSREVQTCKEILQAMDFRYFAPSVTSCPGCGRTSSNYFQILAQDVNAHIEQNMLEWKKEYPGVEKLKIAVMGCVVNGPGESRHADIGISLPGASEKPIAPVYVDGSQFTTLKGDHIKEEFTDILMNYIKNRFQN